MERKTKQRTAIMDAFTRADRPLSPDEVHKAAGKELAGLGKATVYRTIRKMVEESQLAEVALPGEASRYELAGKKHHHHFHCRKCDRVFELHGCPGGLKRLVPKGFRVQSHELILTGHCASCAS